MQPKQRDWLTRRALNKLMRRELALHQAASELIGQIRHPRAPSRLLEVAAATWFVAGQLDAELPRPIDHAPVAPSRTLATVVRLLARVSEPSALWALRWAFQRQLGSLREARKLVDGRAHALLRERVVPVHAYALSLLEGDRAIAPRPARLAEGV